MENEKKPSVTEWLKAWELTANEYVREIEQLRHKCGETENSLSVLSGEIRVWITNLKNFLK